MTNFKWIMESPYCSQISPLYNLDTYYHPNIANSAIPTFNDKSLWNIPLPTAAWSKQEQQEEQPVYCALSASTQPSLKALAIYLHSCAGWPFTETWCVATANVNYLSWPHLPQFTGPALIRKHLLK